MVRRISSNQKKHYQLSRECQVDQVKQTCQIVQHNQLSSRPPASRHLDQWKHNQFQENCHLDKRIVISTSCISSLWMSTGSPPPSLPLFSATCSALSAQTWDLSKNLHDRRFQGKKITQKTRNFRHLLNHDKKCVNALNWDKTSKKCSVTM